MGIPVLVFDRTSNGTISYSVNVLERFDVVMKPSSKGDRSNSMENLTKHTQIRGKAYCCIVEYSDTHRKPQLKLAPVGLKLNRYATRSKFETLGQEPPLKTRSSPELGP